MKKLTVLGAAAVAALLITSHAIAQVVAPADPTIGVQFAPYYGTPGDMLNNTLILGFEPNPAGYQAGALNQQYWNVANNSTGGGDGVPSGPLDNTSLLLNSNGVITPAPVLLDSNGNATSVLFQLSGSTQNRYTRVNTDQNSSPWGPQTWYEANGSTPSYLMSGVQATTDSINPVVLSFAGLNDRDYYNVYAYVNSLNYFGSQLAAIGLGNQTVYLLTDSGTLTGYTQATATTADSATMANYVEFTNIRGSLIDQDLGGNSVTVTGAGTGFSGFQLEDIGSTPAAVPEPSTVWMFSLGFLGLMFHVYRRRNARA